MKIDSSVLRGHDAGDGYEYTGQVRILRESFNAKYQKFDEWLERIKGMDYTYQGEDKDGISYALSKPIMIVRCPNPKFDKIEHGGSHCKKRDYHGWILDCKEIREKRYDKLNAQAIANGHAGVCRENAENLGKCWNCGHDLWSDDEELSFPQLGEQRLMHMDCAYEHSDIVRRENEGDMGYDPAYDGVC